MSEERREKRKEKREKRGQGGKVAFFWWEYYGEWVVVFLCKMGSNPPIIQFGEANIIKIIKKECNEYFSIPKYTIDIKKRSFKTSKNARHIFWEENSGS